MRNPAVFCAFPVSIIEIDWLFIIEGGQHHTVDAFFSSGNGKCF